MNVTAPPSVLVVLLNEPPFGLTLQVTPAESFVVALSASFWPTVRPARVGEIETEIVTGGDELELLEEWLEDDEELLEDAVELLEDEEELPPPADEELLEEELLEEEALLDPSELEEELLPEDAVELEDAAVLEEVLPAGSELSFFGTPSSPLPVQPLSRAARTIITSNDSNESLRESSWLAARSF